MEEMEKKRLEKIEKKKELQRIRQQIESNKKKDSSSTKVNSSFTHESVTKIEKNETLLKIR
jgi:hypothetical protein